MLLSVHQLVALCAASSITLLSILAVLYATYSKKPPQCTSCADTFDNFGRKKYAFLVFILSINVGLSYIVYHFGGTRTLMIVIVGIKSKDILTSLLSTVYYIVYYLYKMIKFMLLIKDVDVSGVIGNIVSIIPVYSETKIQIDGTIQSIINDNKYHGCNNLICIICDGKPINIEESLTQTVDIFDVEYISWKLYKNTLKVTSGYIDETPCLIMKKNRNQGKRDTLIIGHDIFNFPREDLPNINQQMRAFIRDYVTNKFGLTDFKYMFCTDADSIICKNSFRYLIETIEKRNAVACCGLVKIDFSEGAWSFWCIFQNFQYLFGQYVRRSVESLYGRVVCLPGCITMFKIHESAIKAIKLYAEYPQRDEMFKSIVQLLGTDRRLTNSFLFQGKHIKTVLDKRAICLTIPPCTLYTYLTQRRRWASNSYFNTVALLIGPNQYLITRCFAMFDIIRMSIIYFRIFTTIMFVYKIIIYTTGGGSSNQLVHRLIPCIAILAFPTVFFTIICISHHSMRCMFHKIFLGYLINRLIGMILNLAIISNLFWNIGSTIWGANQQSTPNEKNEQVDESNQTNQTNQINPNNSSNPSNSSKPSNGSELLNIPINIQITRPVQIIIS